MEIDAWLELLLTPSEVWTIALDPHQLDTPSQAETTINVSGDHGSEPIEIRPRAKVETLSNELIHVSDATSYFGRATIVCPDGRGGWGRYVDTPPIRCTIAGSTGMPARTVRANPMAGAGETGFIGAFIRTSDRKYTKIRMLATRQSRMAWLLTLWTMLTLFKNIGGDPVPTEVSTRQFLDDTSNKAKMCGSSRSSVGSLEEGRDTLEDPRSLPPPPPPRAAQVRRYPVLRPQGAARGATDRSCHQGTQGSI